MTGVLSSQRKVFQKLRMAAECRRDAESTDAVSLEERLTALEQRRQLAATEAQRQTAADQHRIDQLRARADDRLKEARSVEEELTEAVNPYRHRFDLAIGLTMRSVPTTSDPEAAMVHAVEVARQALAAIRGEIRTIEDSENHAALLRLALAVALTVAAFAGMVAWNGSGMALLVFPVLAGVAIVVFRLNHAVRLIDRLNRWVAQRHTGLASESGQRFRKVYIGGLNFIRETTERFDNPYVQSGTRAAATMYFSGSAVAVAVMFGYVLVTVVVAVAALIFILWLIGKALE